MSSLELSLKILVGVEDLLHFFVHEVLIGDAERNQEFGSISAPLELRHLGEEPKKNVLNGSFFTMNQVSLERGVEVSRVTKNFEETANSLLGFILGFPLDIYREMGIVKVA